MQREKTAGNAPLDRNAQRLVPCSASVIALGFFDGVHLGHGDLLKRTAAAAKATGRRACALTFDRSPGKDGKLLTAVPDRVRLIRSLYGIDEVLVLPFTEAFKRQSWEVFLETLVRDYGAAHLVCGWDYRFGWQGQGTAEVLRRWCAAHGLDCDIIPPRMLDGVTVSSTYLKTLLEAGQTEAAIRFYGHPHTLSGTVQHGRRLGHMLGFPTANLLPPPELLLPKDGVYAVRATVSGTEDTAHTVRRCTEEGDARTFIGVCNIGTRPTVEGHRRTVETWLSGFEGDLYGRELTVDFYCRLRDEKRFPSLEALREEIFRNRQQAQAYFHNNIDKEELPMKELRQGYFSGERALFGEHDLRVVDSVFDAGESPLKECRDLELRGNLFRWKYPLWYCQNVDVEGCTWFEMARAGVWYTDHIRVKNAVIQAPKNFRRCNGLTLEDVVFTNPTETVWSCKNVRMKNVSAAGAPYFCMNSENLEIDGLTLDGNYSFDGVKNMVIRNSRLLTKDAFWNTENVTVYDSFISGEYLGWNAKNLTLVNCTIESLQGMCYIENLKMVNCKLVHTALAFEYSSVEAEITSKIDSVLNPTSGTISAPAIGELVLEKDFIDPGKTVIRCAAIDETFEHPEWRR